METFHLSLLILLSSIHLLLSFPTTPSSYTLKNGRRCVLCPPGQYQSSCSRCSSCPPGTFTSKRNAEQSCHRCYGDCSADYHLRVGVACSSVADLRCVCAAGFRCSERVPFSQNCRRCVGIGGGTTAETAAEISDKDERMNSSTSSPPSTTSSSTSSSSSRQTDSLRHRCLSPPCGPAHVSEEEKPAGKQEGQISVSLAAVLCSLLVLGFLVLVVLIRVRPAGGPAGFSQAVAKLCHEEGPEVPPRWRQSSPPFFRDSFRAKPAPPSVSAANLGPVHVHNPRTVIFGLLNHVTEPVGPAAAGRETDERGGKEEAFPPPPRPSVPLSEEERSFLFPSQETGKDPPLSNEESL